MMVPRAPPVSTPPPVFRPNWETLVRLASTRSKPLDLDMCPTPSHPPIGFVAQPTNRSLLDFEVKTKKPSRWFWGLNHQTRAADFEAQTGKPSTTLVLRLNQEIVTTGFEAKSEKTVLVLLSPNHWQTIALYFEAQPRNQSPRARCRSYTTSPDLSIVWQLTTRPVWLSPFICTRFPTITFLITARHAAPAHHETSKRDSSHKIDSSEITKMSQIWIQTLACQWLITIKSRYWPLGFSISPLMSPLTTKAQSLKFESKIPWSTARRLKKPRKAREGHLEEGKL